MNSRLATGILLLVVLLGSLLVLWKPWAPDRPTIALGLDLSGGLRVVLQTDIDNPAPEDLQQIRTIITNRVDALGVAEPLVQIQGDNQIVVELPGLSPEDQEQALNLIGQQAVLTFHLVNQGASGWTRSAINEELRKNPSLDVSALEAAMLTKEDLGPALLQGDQLASAQVSYDQFGRPAVDLAFNADGTRTFAEVTRANIGRQLAIVLDDEVFSAPTLQSAINDGRAQITGISGVQEASELALVLRSGALPVAIHTEEVRAIGPTLGADAIRSGALAAAIGGVALLLLLFLYYGLWFGAIAATGLIYTGILIMALLSGLGATLTLPGIAGLILTIGAAVDGNVLSFERIKEELKKGKKLRQAIIPGFKHSTITIIDVNIAHLLVAAALYQYSTGPVKGFAVTLAIGVMASVFSNLVLSRWLIEGVGRRRDVHPPYPIWGTAIPFLRYAPIVTGTSATLAVIGIGLIGFHGFNYGVDFTGGTAFDVRVAGETNAQTLREFFAQQGFEEIVLTETQQPASESREFSVRLASLTDDQRIAVSQALQTELEAVVMQSSSVGPAASADLQRSTILALLVGLGLILIYVAFRFDLTFGIASVLAVAHDLAIVAGVYSLFDLQFTVPTVAALLTVIGYSINDSIVVSDRIRENMRNIRNVSFAEMVDLSINQTLSRTIMTSLTTLLPLLALAVLAGAALRDFSAAIIIGIFVGTYSSIYIVSALVVWWRSYREKRTKASAH